MSINVCDLHTHSTFSDGTLTPTELIKEAEKAGLSAIALTDHNTVAGLPEFLEAARDSKVEAIPGVEFSTEYSGTEVHIVALYVKQEHYERITELVKEARDRKEASNEALIKALICAGYNIDYEEIKQRTNGQVNRAHISAALIEAGYVKDRTEAFATLLSPSGGFYSPPKRLDAIEVIRFIRSIGAVSVLAHPYLNLEGEKLTEFIIKATNAGLVAMETLYSTYDEETAKAAERMAMIFKLSRSGGSDFHGANKPDIALGTRRGGLSVPLSFAQTLKRASEHRFIMVDHDYFNRLREGVPKALIAAKRDEDVSVGDIVELVAPRGSAVVKITDKKRCKNYWDLADKYDKLTLGWGKCEIFNPDFYDNYSTEAAGGLLVLEYELIEFI